jgi:hypothetical protein
VARTPAPLVRAWPIDHPRRVSRMSAPGTKRTSAKPEIRGKNSATSQGQNRSNRGHAKTVLLLEPTYLLFRRGLHHFSNSSSNKFVRLSDRIIGKMGITLRGRVAKVAQNLASEI